MARVARLKDGRLMWRTLHGFLRQEPDGTALKEALSVAPLVEDAVRTVRGHSGVAAAQGHPKTQRRRCAPPSAG